MRLRRVKDAEKKILNHPEYILNIPRGEHYPLNNAFKEDKPLRIEIGSGKGQFIHEMAKRHPEMNFIAIEKFDSAIVKILDKVLIEPLNNLYLVRMDAEFLKGCFKAKSVDKIYLNFSDPWPKVRHEKRRLTHSDFLSIYQEILKENGTIELKTDNRKFFEYSIISMQKFGLSFDEISLDLHQDIEIDNIMTEFEEKFSKTGPIYKIMASF
ncbi:MAG: tRNA (guanosine(46)-N7)-methyltransferase TrmB [Candidatus Izemoplasmataceae bacterium]